MESAWQGIIPDSLLLDIFSYLDIKALGRSAQVCTRWKRVVYDEHLWQNICKKVWNIKGRLAPGKTSWYGEARRLTDHVPTECRETLKKHCDEVLDVSISHNGEYFCTCSKDSLVMMWKLGKVTEFIKAIDTKALLKWELSQYSTFSPNDSLILVCGVKSLEVDVIPADLERWVYGVAAVLTVPDLNIVCVAEMDPPTIFSAWLSDRIFVSSLPGIQANTVNIQAYMVSDCNVSNQYVTPDSNPDVISIRDNIFAGIRYTRNTVRLFTFQGHRNHLMNLLVSNVPVPNINLPKSCDKICCCDTVVSGDLPMSRSCDSEAGTQNTNQHFDKFIESSENEVNVKCSKNRTSISEESFSDMSQVENDSMCIAENCAMDVSYSSEVLCQKVKQYVIFTAGNHNVIAIHEVTAEKRNSIFDENSVILNEESNQAYQVDKLDHTFLLKDCYITGLCLSHDQRLLYFNFREMDKNAPENKVFNPEDELPVSEKVFGKDLKIGCIDLVTMERVKDVEYTGHVGFSTFPAWYICLDASPDYIGSGSEDLRGYLWDRHYGVCVGRLFHSTLDTGNNSLYVMSMHESTVVNGIAFSPVDQETCITVCDDGLIKIWTSKHKVRTERKKKARDELHEKLKKLKDNLFQEMCEYCE